MSASRLDRLKIRAVAMISTSSPGWRAVSRCIRGARNTLPKPSGAPIRTVPETAQAAPRGGARRQERAPLLTEVDNAYSLFMDIRVSVRVYTANYQPVDGETAFKLLPQFEDVLTKMAAAMSIDEINGVKDLKDAFAQYHKGFTDVDAADKSSIQARTEMGVKANAPWRTSLMTIPTAPKTT